MTNRTFIVMLAVLAGAFALAAPANAANNTFSGAVDGTWNTAANWSDGVPTSDDVVFITGKFVTLAGAAATVSGLNLTAGSDLTIDATSLTINGPATLDHSFAVRINNNSTLNLNGSTTWLSGGISFEQSNGGLNIGNGGTLDVAANNLNMSVFSGLATTVLHVLPGGTLTRSATGNGGAVGAPIDNDGTVGATAGRLSLLSATGVHDGVYSPTSPGTVGFTGGTYDLSTTGRLTGTGTLAFANGTVVVPPLSTAFPSPYNPEHTRFEGGRLTLGSSGSTGDVVFTTSFPGRAGSAHLDVLGSTTMTAGAAFESGTTTLHGTTTIGLNGFPMRVNGNGSVNLAGAATVTSDGAFELSGNGTVNVAAGGSLDIATASFSAGSGGSGGAVSVAAGGILRRTTGTDGILTVPLLNQGTVSIDAGRLTLTNASMTQTAGVLDVKAGAVLRLQATPTHGVNLAGGTLRGTGTIRGESIDPGKATVSNTGGTVAPGASPGILTIEGDYIQGAGGTLQAEIAGVTPGSGYDQLVVAGTATLGGTLAIVNDPAFDPPLASTFVVVSATTRTGSFATLTGAQIPGKTYFAQYSATEALLALTPAPLNSRAPSIPASAAPGATLTCDPGSWSGSPAFAFEWLRDGGAIAGATSPGYAVAETDVGRTIVCRVTASNGGGSTTAESNAVVPTATASPPPPPPPPPAGPTAPANPGPAPESTVRGDVAFSQGTSNDLYLACTKLDLLLIDVLPGRRGKVSVTGTADLRLAGRTAEILRDGKPAGNAPIRSDGSFAAAVAAPPKARARNARYQARVGSTVSQSLKLQRRMVATTLQRVGKTLLLRGRISPPFARQPAVIGVQRFLSCRQQQKVAVARVVPNARGEFTIRIPLPAGARAAIYRAITKVATRRSGRPTASTFTLPRAIDLG